MNHWFTVYINFNASQLCRVYTDSIVATKDLTFMGTALCMAFLLYVHTHSVVYYVQYVHVHTGSKFGCYN